MIRSRINSLINRGLLYIPHSAAYAGGVKDMDNIEAQIVSGLNLPESQNGDDAFTQIEANRAAGYAVSTVRETNKDRYYLVGKDLNRNQVIDLIGEVSESFLEVAPTLFAFYGISSNNNGTSYLMGGISAIEITRSKGTAFTVRPNTVAMYYDKHDLNAHLKDENISLRFSGATSALSIPWVKDGAEEEVPDRLVTNQELPSMNEGQNLVPSVIIVVAKMANVPVGPMRRNWVVVKNGKGEVLTPSNGDNRICLHYKHVDYSVSVFPLSITSHVDTNLTIESQFNSVIENAGITVLYSSSVNQEITLAKKE